MRNATLFDVPAAGRNRRETRFDERLALFQWLVELLECGSMEALGKELNRSELEGFDDDGRSRFFLELQLRRELVAATRLTGDQLREYDASIALHWRAITEKRNIVAGAVYPKYFQYLSLLFTEVFLDRYFHDSDALVAELNRFLAVFNQNLPSEYRLPQYEKSDLNKIAFWMATGSGKTLLMHVNIRQYLHYLRGAGKRHTLNRIILLTPNEGLSRQHLCEFKQSGIEAELFSKSGGAVFSGGSVEIIDINKLRETSGDKTVAVESFESNNLVLVDEGHRGSSAEEGKWMALRDKLCSDGFSFEYSATFGQAMRGRRDALASKYAKCILFDYSYKYFHKDGYGKDYRILNLESDKDGNASSLYLTACLMTHYQQLRLFEEKRDVFAQFLLAKPLWVFVGSSVNAVRTQEGRQVSDVTTILLFLGEFVNNREAAVERIKLLLEGHAGLMAGNRELFSNAFGYVAGRDRDAGSVYTDILKRLFHAGTSGLLHVENLKGSEGEIALSVGSNKPFGVINVGDAPKLVTLCESYAGKMVTGAKEFSESLFRSINSQDSEINILIGSKKFSEGWSSWRVSTMGLMNLGRSEGAEIIQLFGRGVRLKGFKFSLKRSEKIPEIRTPEHMKLLETLNVFGVRANYMQEFKNYLEAEGVPTGDPWVIEIPTVRIWKGTPELKWLKIPDDAPGFKEAPEKPTLGSPPNALIDSPLILDWYPRIKERSTQGIGDALGDVAIKEEHRLTADHVAFMNIDALYFALVDYKNERSWYNLNVSRDAVRELLLDGRWYKLLIAKRNLDFDSFACVRLWQEIALALLKKYCDRFYKYEKSRYESPFLRYENLDPSDANQNTNVSYRVSTDESKSQFRSALEALREQVLSGVRMDWAQAGLKAVFFEHSLYEPLLELAGGDVQITPAALNKDEGKFVRDLRTFVGRSSEILASHSVYLLRNQSRGRGLGFFEAGNFYPDFVLWILRGKMQTMIFVDPKGIRNLAGFDDPKIGFAKTVVARQNALGDPDVRLRSFILSNTRRDQVNWATPGEYPRFDDSNVLFTEDDNYIDKMVRRSLVGVN